MAEAKRSPEMLSAAKANGNAPSETEIRVAQGYTISLAPYESARVDVSISKKVFTNSKLVVNVIFEQLWNKVEHEVGNKLIEIREAYDSTDG